jgi:hypothetical protein
VREAARAFGRELPAGESADDILRYLRSDAAKAADWINFGSTKTPAPDGWDPLVRAATYADGGHLVVGGVTRDELNRNRPDGVVEYKDGKVFVLFPSEKRDWDWLLVAAAGRTAGGKARVTPIGGITPNWQRPLVHFAAARTKRG